MSGLSLELALALERLEMSRQALRFAVVQLESCTVEWIGAFLKALPPAPEESVKRARWWQLWGPR